MVMSTIPPVILTLCMIAAAAVLAWMRQPIAAVAVVLAAGLELLSLATIMVWWSQVEAIIQSGVDLKVIFTARSAVFALIRTLQVAVLAVGALAGRAWRKD